jgi:hypothetical protein
LLTHSLISSVISAPRVSVAQVREAARTPSRSSAFSLVTD